MRTVLVIMYDPENPLLASRDVAPVAHTLQAVFSQSAPTVPTHNAWDSPPPQHVPTKFEWRDLRHTLRSLVMEHYQQCKVAMDAKQIWDVLSARHGKIFVEVDLKLLVILLDNMGGFVRKEQ